MLFFLEHLFQGRIALSAMLMESTMQMPECFEVKNLKNYVHYSLDGLSKDVFVE